VSKKSGQEKRNWGMVQENLTKANEERRVNENGPANWWRRRDGKMGIVL